MAWSKNTTIAEIARHANVSIATVSRVINQAGNVRPETSARVLRAMENLHFEARPPEKPAQPLGRNILLSFPNLQNPFNDGVIRGVYGAATQHGYEVFVYQPGRHRNVVAAYEAIMREQRFAGMILAHTINDHAALEELCGRYPIVMCSEHYKSDKISFVAIDDYASAKTAMAYLLSIGRRRPAFINSPLQFNYATQRERGYMDTLAGAGIAANPAWVVHLPEINYNLAVSAATTILRGEQPPDCFFCVSDIFAAAVIKAANNLGYSVPGDIAVVGFDNIDIANMMVPSITTISQPAHQLGAQACNLLLDQINGNQNLNTHIILDTELVVRGST